MLQVEVLVLKCLEAPNGGGAGAITIEKVAALAHEIGDLICPVSKEGYIDGDIGIPSFPPSAIEEGQPRQGRGWRDTHNTVELGALVALGATDAILGLSGAELAEVLGGFGNHVFE